MAQPTAVIRPYRETDHAAVYDVCVRTADGGGDARGMYHSDDLMPDLFAGPYLFLEPDFAFVLDDGQRAVGYVIGTPDTAAFARAYAERLDPPAGGPLPGPAGPAGATRTRRCSPCTTGRSGWSGPASEEYPAHLHIDLLPPFQRAGHGRALMETFYAAAAGAGAVGVHVTVSKANTNAIGFYRRLGFRPLQLADPPEVPVLYLARPL